MRILVNAYLDLDFFFEGNFCPPGFGSTSLIWIRIRIQPIKINADPYGSGSESSTLRVYITISVVCMSIIRQRAENFTFFYSGCITIFITLLLPPTLSQQARAH
jgi:hypothetical protein